MYENFYAVIMAGGSGTRLWPLSRKDRPKQSLAIFGQRSLFQLSVNRLQGLFPPERILVVTIADQVALLSEECPEIPADNFLIEPMPRGTASVVGLAAVEINQRKTNASMAILTADHLIKNEAHLQALLISAYDVAGEGFLVTLGITPTFPATGFGYIQKDEKLGSYNGLTAYHVKKFKEKPGPELAEQLVADGQHVWNSGMFIWQVDTVMEEMSRQMPDLHQKLEKISEPQSSASQRDRIETLWPTIEPQTIDYGIMENAQKVAVIPAMDLGWHDVGSWESLFEAMEGDEHGNIILDGETIAFDTQGTLICEDSSNRLIVTMGVENLIIVDSGNVVLVIDRKHAQNLREIVDQIKQEERNEFL